MSRKHRLTRARTQPMFMHLSAFRYIVLALVCLLVSGGSQTALAFAGPTGFQTSLGESASLPVPSDALTALLFDEHCESLRSSKERAPSEFPYTTWADPCHPPVASYARIFPTAHAPAKGVAEKVSEFARAPPFRS